MWYVECLRDSVVCSFGVSYDYVDYYDYYDGIDFIDYYPPLLYDSGYVCSHGFGWSGFFK